MQSDIIENATTRDNFAKFDGPTFESQMKRLRTQKNNLETLANKVKVTKEDLINSNLSGETYKKSIEMNEFYEKQINNRITDLDSLINKLEIAYNEYMECVKDNTTSVKG